MFNKKIELILKTLEEHNPWKLIALLVLASNAIVLSNSEWVITCVLIIIFTLILIQSIMTIEKMHWDYKNKHSRFHSTTLKIITSFLSAIKWNSSKNIYNCPELARAYFAREFYFQFLIFYLIPTESDVIQAWFFRFTLEYIRDKKLFYRFQILFS